MKHKRSFSSFRISPVALVGLGIVALIALPLLMRVLGMVLGLVFGAIGLIFGLVFGLLGIFIALFFSTIWLWLPALVVYGLIRSAMRRNPQTVVLKNKRSTRDRNTLRVDENGDEFFYEDDLPPSKHKNDTIYRA